jgi:hypothetical protein
MRGNATMLTASSALSLPQADSDETVSFFAKRFERRYGLKLSLNQFPHRNSVSLPEVAEKIAKPAGGSRLPPTPSRALIGEA